MKITTPRINSYPAVKPNTHKNEQDGQHISSPDIIEQKKGITFQEEINIQENLQFEHRGKSVLNGKEKATLHALFGAEKPSEMTFYGRTQLQHIHKGQLLNIKG